MMKEVLQTSIVLGALCLVTVAGEGEKQTHVNHARRFLQLIRDGQFDAIEAAADTPKYPRLTATRVQATWNGVVYTFGPYIKERHATVVPSSARVTVRLTCEFRDMGVDAYFSFDNQGRLVGLHFAPNGDDIEYIPPPYADQTRFEEEEINVVSGRFVLPGMLTVPKRPGAHPAVVLVHGMGPIDQDESLYTRKPFKDLAWGLASRGVAVIRYEKRTHKYPEAADASNLDIDTETADDALAAADLLFRRSDIRKDRVFLFGHSLGAGAAPYIAGRDPRLAGVIMFGAPARPLYETLVHQVRYTAGLDGNVSDAEQSIINEIETMAGKLRDGTWQPGDMLTCHPVEYWLGIDRMAPVKHAKASSAAILIIQGGRDFQVPDEEFEIWKRELAGRPNITLERLEALDHSMVAGEGPSSLEHYKHPGHVDSRLIELVAEWIHDQP